jgi:hypothetical protein
MDEAIDRFFLVLLASLPVGAAPASSGVPNGCEFEPHHALAPRHE